MGLDKLVPDFEYSMNQTAELASIEASEIIVKAVLSLRFNDAIQILNGSENSATLYLKDNLLIIYILLFILLLKMKWTILEFRKC